MYYTLVTVRVKSCRAIKCHWLGVTDVTLTVVNKI